MNHSKLATALASSLALVGCAKHTDEIQASYTSPLQYQGYSCKQIGREIATVTRHVQDVGGYVEKTADSDDVEMGVGLVLLWPTLFFLDGDTPQATEYARLKGQFDALESAANQKNCDLHIEQPVIKRNIPESPTDNSNRNGIQR